MILFFLNKSIINYISIVLHYFVIVCNTELGDDCMEEKNNTKPTSLRLGEADLKKFKAYAEKMGLSQGEAFSSLISLAELEKARTTLNNRANNIDTFRNTINSLLVFYVNALEENAQAEERIRQEFSKMLDSKENTIQTFQNKIQELKEILEELKTYKEQQNNVINNYENEIKTLTENLYDKQKQIDTLTNNNNMLQEQLIEYKNYKKEYKSLEEELKILEKKYKSLEEDSKQDIEKLKSENLSYANKIDNLKEKLKNSDDMLKFYREQIIIKDNEIKENKDYSKSKETELKQEITNLKAEHKAELLKLEKNYDQRIKDLSRV